MKNAFPMMSLSILLLSGCVSTVTEVQTYTKPHINHIPYSDVVDFRGLVFGKAAPTGVVFKLLDGDYTADRNEMYTRIDDEMRIGDVEVKSIYYSFFDEKLYSVYVDVGQDDLCMKSETIKGSIEIKYKTKLTNKFPRRTDATLFVAEFQNLKIMISCDILLSEARKPKTTVIISHPEISVLADKYDSQLMERAAKEKAIKGAKDL